MIDLKLTISDAQLRRAVAAMIIFEVALAALNFAPFPWPTIERQLSLESEGNFPTWLASMQLFVMAVVAWFIGRQATPERGQRMLWGAASVVLLLISIDEVSTTHEILGHDAAQRL
ncbi:hypothetical protein KKH27_07245, partial [bacterium]|nr:hypothetical protein [bacterium]MBU1983940.1 hypothetical protein [bacterium]